MAHHQVAARIDGDDFQGRMFWIKATELYTDPPHLARIAYEYDQAIGVDDLVLFYHPPGIADGPEQYDVDALQAKFHVDHKGVYSSDFLLEVPRGSKTSLLQKMHKGYRALHEAGHQCRLILVSNWGWDDADDLAKSIRADGKLPDTFFSDGPGTKLGKIREAWRTHLGIDGSELADFARRVRWELYFFACTRQLDYMAAKLQNAGLRPPDPTKRVNPYDDLIRKLLCERRAINVDADALREICAREDLVAGECLDPIGRRVGLRSYMRWAETMEADCIDHVCVAEHFDGRYIRAPALWNGTVYTEVVDFLDKVVREQAADEILLECHLSLAYLAGTRLPAKCGLCVAPVQKGRRGREAWRPGITSEGLPEWNEIRRSNEGGSADVVVALSVTHAIGEDVSAYCQEDGLNPVIFLELLPEQGVGPHSILGPDHAQHLAVQALDRMRQARGLIGRGARVHLFAAAPNALLFFLGQVAGDLLQPIQLYEHDWEGVQSGLYLPSLCLPPNPVA
ncbi:MAG: SAVED domain-containing protein [Pseudomonadota bacterium]|nr:SAVED domain-containing protein [Pseudomonadota bacterium]